MNPVPPVISTRLKAPPANGLDWLGVFTEGDFRRSWRYNQNSGGNNTSNAKPSSHRCDQTCCCAESHMSCGAHNRMPAINQPHTAGAFKRLPKCTSASMYNE